MSQAYSAASLRAMDQRAISTQSISGYELMKRAGQAAFDDIRRWYPDARNWAVVCGAGNNAGDGYVLASLATTGGIDCTTIAVTPGESLKGDAALAFRDFAKLDGAKISSELQIGKDCDVVVDGLLGIGADRELKGRFSHAVEMINAHAAPCVALDLPSGIHADNGRQLGDAVRADMTISFIADKAGFFLAEGPRHCGLIVRAGLGVESTIISEQSAAIEVMGGQPPFGLTPRPVDSHKGKFGRLLLAGGDYGMAGAIQLAASAAQRSGAGVVSVATRPEHALGMTHARPELMCHGVHGAGDFGQLLSSADVLAIGPGLGRSDWAESLLAQAERSGLPVIADADALNALAGNPRKLERWILTPHPGEAARLLNCSVAEVQEDRLKAVTEICERYGSVCVLKGRGTLVGAPGGSVALISGGNPGMATAGMGDVLCGIIAGFRAQGLSAISAARTGALVHNHAADRQADAAGPRGMCASDVIEELRACVN